MNVKMQNHNGKELTNKHRKSCPIIQFTIFVIYNHTGENTVELQKHGYYIKKHYQELVPLPFKK